MTHEASNATADPGMGIGSSTPTGIGGIDVQNAGQLTEDVEREEHVIDSIVITASLEVRTGSILRDMDIKSMM